MSVDAENSLPGHAWHQTLLENMALEVEGVRPAVIDDSLRRDLIEILKFRHFSRYYFELDYDWDKLRFLLVKFKAIHQSLPQKLSAFTDHLEALLEGSDEGS